jgi:hypothetical protein
VVSAGTRLQEFSFDLARRRFFQKTMSTRAHRRHIKRRTSTVLPVRNHLSLQHKTAINLINLYQHVAITHVVVISYISDRQASENLGKPHTGA